MANFEFTTVEAVTDTHVRFANKKEVLLKELETNTGKTRAYFEAIFAS